MYITKRNRFTDTEDKVVVTIRKERKGKQQKLRVELKIQTAMYKVDKQQGYIMAQEIIASILILNGV